MLLTKLLNLVLILHHLEDLRLKNLALSRMPRRYERLSVTFLEFLKAFC